jgi:hypothetical protein
VRGKLILSYYPFASSKPQVTGDVSPGPNLPKEKEPPHRGDIGWDRFLLRQFGLQSYSLFPSYKLCDNMENASLAERSVVDCSFMRHSPGHSPLDLVETIYERTHVMGVSYSSGLS